MRHSELDFQKRAQLRELMDEPSDRETTRAYLESLSRVNRWFLAMRPTLAWLDGLELPRNGEPVRILDVGCGYGDGLRRIERWARERGLRAELIGLDLNPDTAAIAAEASDPESRIEWVTSDVFGYASTRKVDMVVSALFTHHLDDDQVVRFLRWMEANCTVGWFINDLSRAPIPYYLFRWFSRLARMHPGVQNDGPISIARAFVVDDWLEMCALAGLSADDVTIREWTPARICVSRRKL